MTIAALGAVTLVLGIVYALLRDRDDRDRGGSERACAEGCELPDPLPQGQRTV